MDTLQTITKCSHCPILNFEDDFMPYCGMYSPVASYMIRKPDGEYEEHFYSTACKLVNITTTEGTYEPETLGSEDVLCEHGCDDCISFCNDQGSCAECKHNVRSNSSICMFASLYDTEKDRPRNGGISEIN